MLTRLFITLVLTIPSLAYANSSQSKLNQIKPEYRSWIHDSCPASLGPASWNSCVDRHVKAIRNNFPDKKLESAASSQRQWINDSCSRSLGPSSWASCVNRNLKAFDDDFPESRLLSLDASSQAWINDTCPRSLGPSSWSSCVKRNAASIVQNAYPQKKEIENAEQRVFSAGSQQSTDDLVTKWEVNTNNVALLQIDYNTFSGSGTSLVAWPENNDQIVIGFTTLWLDPKDRICDESKEKIHRINGQAVRFITSRIGTTQCTEIPKSVQGTKFVAEAFINGKYVQWNNVQLSAIGFISAINKVTEGYNAL
ncbi:hypothetical protein AB6E02_05005 [Vibrio cyclitrophicus]